MEYKNCPNCENVGWYVDANYYTGEAEQVQCEFCYTEENSIFNTINKLQAENEELKAKLSKAKELMIESQRLLRNGAGGAISNTVWSDTRANATLYELLYEFTNEMA